MLNLFKRKTRLLNKESYIFRGKPFPVYDHFVTSSGERVPLLSGFRDWLKPDWRDMLKKNDLTHSAMSKEAMSKKIGSNKKRVAVLDKFLRVHDISLTGKSVLEVGCFTGATTFCLSHFKPARIVGSDLSKYYINQSVGKKITDETLKKQFSKLTLERDAFREFISSQGDMDLCRDISFVEDDITGSKFDPGTFDFICGFEVMEHTASPYDSLSEMSRILKQGGVIFQEYNPFFCLEGGHSLCTLDFPWGHARLSKDDFIRYTDSYRKNEAEVDQAFYLNNLNRMTLTDLLEACGDLELKVTELIKWSDNGLLTDILDHPEILKQCRENNQKVSINDLISDKIWVLLQKA